MITQLIRGRKIKKKFLDYRKSEKEIWKICKKKKKETWQIDPESPLYIKRHPLNINRSRESKKNKRKTEKLLWVKKI